MKDLLARIAGWCVERPLPVLATAGLLALIAAVGALRLHTDAGTDQLVDSDSEAFVATEQFKESFGDDAVVVLVQGDLRQLVLTEDLGTLLSLEGCLSGNAPGGQVFTDEPSPEPCAKLAATKPAKAVLGGATFLNQAVLEAGRLLQAQSEDAQTRAREAGVAAAAAARRQGLGEAAQQAAAQAAAYQVQNAFIQQLFQLGIRYGQLNVPRLDDTRFVQRVVFDDRTANTLPKPRFSIFWPSAEAAQILVRLRPDLSDSQRRDAIELIRDAVADPAFQIRDADYVISGVPVVVEGLADKLSSQIFVLLAAAIVVMALTLLLIMNPPLRLLPLAIALGAAAMVFGLLAAFGGSLTLGSVAVLPILIGLSVDYAIQFHSRFVEARDTGSSPPRAAVEAAARGGPVIATAALATAAGFLVLLLSPVPLVRGFGILLVAGIAIAFTLIVTMGLVALSLSDGGTAAAVPKRSGRGAHALGSVTRFRSRASERIRAIGRSTLAVAVAAPGRVLAAGLVLAVLGWGVSTQTEVVSDIRELVPRDLPELQDVDTLEQVTGVSGELDVAVTTDDLTDPAVVAWMADFKRRVLERAGYSPDPTPCADQDSQLCPFVALPDLYGEQTPADRESVEAILDLLPAYFLNAFIAGDPGGERTSVIPFGIKVMPFDHQKELIDAVRAEIDPPGTENDPPPGVEAEVVGLPVLAADANSELESNRYLMTIAGLLAVALALLAAYRSLRRALVPLIPIALATGWSALGLEITGVPLNPMSATLGALVIAIATEFSVLLSARFEEEHTGAVPVGEALRRAYSRTGTAVLASGVTAIAGFAALIATDIRMLRDFGFVTVLDLSVALLGVLIVLPAALVWTEARKTTPARSSASHPVSPGRHALRDGRS